MSTHVILELNDVGDLGQYPTFERLGEEVWHALRQACMNAHGNPVRLMISTDPVAGPNPFGEAQVQFDFVFAPEDDAAWEDMGPRAGHVLLELPLP